MNILNVSLTYSDLLYAMAFYFVCLENMARKEPVMTLVDKRYFAVWGILLFTGVGIHLGMLRSPDPFGAFGAFLQYAFLFVILLTVLHYLIDNQIKNVVKVLGFYLIPSLVSGVIVALSDFGVLHSFDDQIIYGLGRYRGFDGSLPTAYGAKTALAFVIIYMFWRISKHRLSKLFWLMMTLLSAYVIFLTASFGAILMLGISVFCIWWFASKRKAIMRFLAIIMVFCGISLFYLHETGNATYMRYMPQIIQVRFEASDGEFGSYDVRMELNRLGIVEFFNSPFAGVGYTQFVDYNPYHRVVHNTVISAAVESGIFGLIGVLIYLYIPAVYSLRLARDREIKEEERIVLQFLVIFAISRLVQTFTSHEFILRDEWIPGLVIIALYTYRSHRLRVKEKIKQVNMKPIEEPSI